MDKPAVQNVHVRRLAASIERVRPWIEACWSNSDRDCFPRDVIANWRKNPPGTAALALIPGETMIGHGPFRFRLRSWNGYVWRVDLVGSLSGWHGFDLAPDGAGCLVTHTLELTGPLSARVAWLAIAPIHDWVVEAMFDRLEQALTTGAVPPRSERPMSRTAAFALRLARRRTRRRVEKRGAQTEARLQAERLPYIDEHRERIEASPERVWAALLTTLRQQFARTPPRLVSAVWGLQQRRRLGEWATSVAVGDTIPGFAVAQSEPTRLLTLRGGHRFSRYELRFELDSARPRCVDIHAQTSAAFPGLLGRIYRALVIGTGGHRFAVRRLLAAVARRATA